MRQGKQCKHLNCSVTEEWISEWTHEFEDGVWIMKDVNEGTPTGKIYAKCPDCGLDTAYSSKRLPKWIQPYVDDMTGR